MNHYTKLDIALLQLKATHKRDFYYDKHGRIHDPEAYIDLDDYFFGFDLEAFEDVEIDTGTHYEPPYAEVIDHGIDITKVELFNDYDVSLKIPDNRIEEIKEAIKSKINLCYL